MVEVYITNFSKLPDPKDRKQLMASLNPERRLRIAKAANEKARRQCLASALLLQLVLKEKGLDANQVRTNRFGKPEIDGIYFNISHSGDMVVCAVSEKPVGCDIERIREAPRKVSSRYFGEQEKLRLEKLQGFEFDCEFFRLWTMKESYVKMTGEGLRVPLGAFEIAEADSISIIREGKKQACNIKEYEVPGYRLTVCAEEEEFDKEMYIVKVASC